MKDTILFCLANAGLAYIVTQSHIFKPVREFFKNHEIYVQANLDRLYPEGWMYGLLSCPMCFGWWSSIPTYLLVFRDLGLQTLLYCFIGSITAYFAHQVIRVLKAL